MMRSYRIILLAILFPITLFAQEKYTELNLQGKDALRSGKKEEAEKLFAQSVKFNQDADSYYQLAKIYFKNSDNYIANLGYDYVVKAKLKDEKSYDYRYLYLDYLEDFGSKNVRMKEYWKIFDENPLQVKALFKIAGIKFAEYEKYRALKVDTERWYLDYDLEGDDLTDDVKIELDSAEILYTRGLKIDSLNYDGLFGITKLYQSTGRPDIAIQFLEKISKYYPMDKEAHLQLGIYYYRKKKIDEAFKEFQMGLNLMDAEEKEDYTYNSVEKMLEPKYPDQFKTMAKEEKKAFIDKWWQASDPLYLSSYNERVVEHYARVAYSNLFFSVPDYGLVGWKSDRGQVLIRYGEPARVQKMKQNLQIDDDLRGTAGLGGIGIKNTSLNITFRGGNSKGVTGVINPNSMPDQFIEIWEYNNIPGFSFSGDKNYYKLITANEFEEIWRKTTDSRQLGTKSIPSTLNSRATINSLKDYEDLKRQKVQSYKPVLYGSKLNVENKIYIFHRLKEAGKSVTDLYFAYLIPTKDTSNVNEIKDGTHEIGAFFFDSLFDPILQVRDTIQDPNIKSAVKSDNPKKVNCLGFGLKPGKISFAFDLRRKLDSNYYSYRKTISIPQPDVKALALSDVALTSEIFFDKELPMGMKRGDISFYPSVDDRFKNNEKFFIYYEVYNLHLDEKKEGNYEQIITIRPKGEEGISLKKMVKGLTTILTGEEGKVSLTTDYRTSEENTQVFMQLDLSEYKPGKYDLIITVNDKISGNVIEKKTDLEIIK